MTVTINWEKLLPSDKQVHFLESGDTFTHQGKLYMFRTIALRKAAPFGRDCGMKAFCIDLSTGDYAHLDLSTVVEPVDIEITVVRK